LKQAIKTEASRTERRREEEKEKNSQNEKRESASIGRAK